MAIVTQETIVISNKQIQYRTFKRLSIEFANAIVTQECATELNVC